MVAIRLQADNETEAREAVQILNYMCGAGIVLQPPRQGTNPKYEGNQKWFVYGTLKVEALIWLIRETMQPKEIEAGGK
jgi:hypothetical protein